ncbi:hypothetical protein G6F16_011123 [Rhizopus arrhizus]|uniref:Uncharacterized protein n=1 Tax=Rhizopus oryzae TaxID=64495 RepID=A0A9P6X0K4_RHIOR|nr:hypothetical protein G6F23_007858 [Rhizopus arrhizus]KAG0756556.1 hypothetical protein G6F24_011072 [Rhizopus arrhizus]KAG0783122.1 hypothetical protein G6F21_010715 [Rhizopus arrhizus]KAG0791345.1 hypothetical protein G6F22_006163 [Rhizopus arrhizus]KAG0806494.1 hypothetical protein G6F20_011081 [Rhizopus arrhizus]
MKEALLSLEKRDKISIHRPADTQDVIQSGKDTFVLQYACLVCVDQRQQRQSRYSKDLDSLTTLTLSPHPSRSLCPS